MISSNYEKTDMSTSVGIICIKLDKSIEQTFKKKLESVSYYDLNTIIMDNIHKFNEYNNSIRWKRRKIFKKWV